MSNDGRHDRATALMISHGFPDPLGGADRARAWQLLKLLSRGHRVFLACRYDGPVSLIQWRLCQRLAERIVLKPVKWRHQLIDRYRGARGRGGASLPGDLGRWGSIGSFAQERVFDLVLCTHPSLSGLARSIESDRRVCDINTGVDLTDHPQIIASFGQRARTGLHIASPGGHHLIRSVSPYDPGPRDIATFADPSQMGDVDKASHHTISLPTAVDLDLLNGVGQSTGEIAHPCIVLHADWTDKEAHRTRKWFVRRVWPGIRHANPRVELRSTRPGTQGHASDHLRSATLVVVPMRDPVKAKLPVLQAVAMRKAIVVPGAVGRAMGMSHERDIVLTGDKNEWIDGCLRMIRSRFLRLRAAKEGFAIARKHGSIETSGREFLRTITGSPGLDALPKAA